MKLHEILNKKPFLDPKAEARLEALLDQTKNEKDLSVMRQAALDFIDNLQFKEKARKFRAAVIAASSIKKIQFTLYNIKLAGEGLSII